jgi:hypothetical protein
MKHEMRHDLTPELAKKAAVKAFESYQERYGKYHPQLTWLDEQHAEVAFSAKGITLTGRAELKPRSLVFELDVPFVFKVFKKRAVSIIERELGIWVAKAKAGELERS